MSAAVLDNEESRACRYSMATRLADGHIPFALCAHTGQTSASFVIPAWYRPVVGAKVIEMPCGLLQPALSGAAASAILSCGLVDASSEFSDRRGSPAHAPQSTKFNVKEPRGGKPTAAKQARAAQNHTK